MMIKTILLLSTALLLKAFAIAQQITYTQPSEDNAELINFSIIGKLSNHYLFYAQENSSYKIMIYDGNMELTNRVDMDFLPAALICSDIISSKNYFYFIYQYKKDNAVICMSVCLNSEGKITEEPKFVDSTVLNFPVSNRVYNITYSENKHKISIFKIINRDGVFIFTSCLFDEHFDMLGKFSEVIPTNSKNSYLSDFKLDDDGSIAFVKISDDIKLKGVQNISLFIKKADENSFNVFPVYTGKIYLNDVSLQKDDLNDRFIITGFFSKKAKADISGIYCAVWNKTLNKILFSKQTFFTREFKNNANWKGHSSSSLNYYQLQNVFMRKDGGFTVASEYYHTVFARIYNRSSPDYTSDANAVYGNDTYSNLPGANGVAKSFYAENIAVMSFDSAANMKWTVIIPKSQYGNNTHNFISYSTCLSNDGINFLFNQSSKKITTMQSVKLDASGKTDITSILKNLNRDYDYMPRFAKQVSKNEIIIPCEYKNKLCFARIDF